jgi:hypothetical protein
VCDRLLVLLHHILHEILEAVIIIGGGEKKTKLIDVKNFGFCENKAGENILIFRVRENFLFILGCGSTGPIVPDPRFTRETFFYTICFGDETKKSWGFELLFYSFSSNFLEKHHKQIKNNFKLKKWPMLAPYRVLN